MASPVSAQSLSIMLRPSTLTLCAAKLALRVFLPLRSFTILRPPTSTSLLDRCTVGAETWGRRRVSAPAHAARRGAAHRRLWAHGVVQARSLRDGCVVAECGLRGTG